MWKSKTFSNSEWCGGWNTGVVGSWTNWFHDFNRRVAWNKPGGANFQPFLINKVVGKSSENQLPCSYVYSGGKSKKTNVFTSIKEINRFRIDINRFLSKGMWNIYLNIQKWHAQNFHFLSLKNLSPGQFLGSFDSRRYDLPLKLLIAT